MAFNLRSCTGWLAAFALVLGLEQAPHVWAQDHVVSKAELQQEIKAAAHARQRNLAKVEKFLSSEPARKALRAAKIDSVKVEKAVSSLNDEELARLALRGEKAQDDFAAGALTNEQLTYVAIALAAAVIVLIATR